MKLFIYDEEIQCDYAAKGKDCIEVYLNRVCIRRDEGISDFSGYSLVDDNGNLADYTNLELDSAAKIKLLEQQLIDTQLALVELYESMVI